MTVEIRDERFLAVVGDAASIALERLATGFDFLEGPVWHPTEHHLTFSDMRGDTIYRWAAGGVTTFRQPSNKANGNAYDREGRLVTCEHATSRLIRTEPDGQITVLATHWSGKQLNSPNDVVVKSDGTIYFTDPTYGRLPGFGVERAQDLDFQGVYRVDADGSGLTLLADDFAQPNGLCFSRDESRLFVNDTDRWHIRVFDVLPDGSLAGGAVWATIAGDGKGGPDGMKIDSAGNLYCAALPGLHVFAPEGEALGAIVTPERCANFNWGDGDWRSIFLAATSSLYRVRTRTPGVPPFRPAADRQPRPPASL